MLTRRANTYFCPRGCNVLTTEDGPPECGGCGSVMDDDPNRLDNVIEMAEERGIAAAERKLGLR